AAAAATMPPPNFELDLVHDATVCAAQDDTPSPLPLPASAHHQLQLAQQLLLDERDGASLEEAVELLRAVQPALPEQVARELPTALYRLARCYRHGWGVKESATLLSLYLEEAACNVPQAAYELAV